MRKVFIHNRIYFVTCEEISSIEFKGDYLERSDEEIVEQVLIGGVRVIQLRDKHSSRKSLLKKAFRIRGLTSNFGAVLIINDDPELALEVGADGVHLGQNDFPVAEVRKLRFQHRKGENLIIGLSTHNCTEVESALTTPVSYINLGPVFPTQTKSTDYPPIVKNERGKYDFSYLQEMIGLCYLSRLPYTVMGGINGSHIIPLGELGVKQFAVISALASHPSPREQASHLIRLAQYAVRKNWSNTTDQEKKSIPKLQGYRSIV